MKATANNTAPQPARRLALQIYGGFGFALVILLVTAFLSYHSVQRFIETSGWVGHTYQVLNTIQKVLSSSLDEQTAARGLVLTGRDDYLEPYYAASANLPPTISRLREITSDNPRQLERIDRLQALVHARAAFVKENLAVRREKGVAAAIELLATGRGERVMQELRAVVREMEQEEQDLLRVRMEQARASGAAVLGVVLGSSLLALVVVPLAGYLIQREVRQRAQAEEERDRFFTSSLDLLCIADMSGHFKRVNPAWEKALGFTVEELQSRPYLEFIHSDDREATKQEAARQAAGLPAISFENRYQCKDGSYRWLLWQAAPDMPRGVIYGVARDITERKQAEEHVLEINRKLEKRTEEVEIVNRELEAFTYSVSHDLRAPLRHVDGFSQVLLQKHAAQLDEQGRHYLKRVRYGAQQMGRLVDDLLNLSRVGRQEFRPVLAGLDHIVQEVLRELQAETRERQIEWRVENLPFVECDPLLIRQVFANLLSNAVKYTRTRTRAVIEVGPYLNNGSTGVFVRDNGVGFSMKYVDKLFGIFQRLHRQEDFEGTGVGLATVQRIIHRHGGRVWAEAELDKGATFYFTLSQSVPEQATETVGATQGGHP